MFGVVLGRLDAVAIVGSTGHRRGGFDGCAQPFPGVGESFVNADLLFDRQRLPDALILELFGRDFVSACAVEPAHVQFGRGVKAEKMRAPDMNQIQRTERRYLRLPVIFLRINDAPVFRLLPISWR